MRRKEACKHLWHGMGQRGIGLSKETVQAQERNNPGMLLGVFTKTQLLGWDPHYPVYSFTVTPYFLIGILIKIIYVT